MILECPSETVSDIQLDISTIGGRSFTLRVKSSCKGFDVKELLSLMDSSLRISMMRLLYGLIEIQDDLPIGATIQGTNGQLALMFRSHACERFLIEVGSHGLETASDEVRADKACVLEQVKLDGHEIQYASQDLKKDKDVVMAAVKSSGSSLMHVAEELRHDRDVVFAAVSNHGQSLEYACAEFQDDIDVVLTAISACNRLADATQSCSQFASNRLRDMPEIVLLESPRREPELKIVCQKSFWAAVWFAGLVSLKMVAVKLVLRFCYAYGVVWPVRALICWAGHPQADLLWISVFDSALLSGAYVVVHVAYDGGLDALFDYTRQKRRAVLMARARWKSGTKQKTP